MKGPISQLKDTIRNLRLSVQSWKKKATEYPARSRSAQDTLVKTQASRDMWKQRCKQAQAKLDKEADLAKKKRATCQHLSKPFFS